MSVHSWRLLPRTGTDSRRGRNSSSLRRTRLRSEPGPGLLPELLAALRGVTPQSEEEGDAAITGAFIVLEGGEGAGKSTQVRELTVWLREQGFEVVGTRQPGATKLGMRLRGILLDRENSHITDRAEVLLRPGRLCAGGTCATKREGSLPLREGPFALARVRPCRGPSGPGPLARDGSRRVNGPVSG